MKNENSMKMCKCVVNFTVSKTNCYTVEYKENYTYFYFISDYKIDNDNVYAFGIVEKEVNYYFIDYTKEYRKQKLEKINNYYEN